MPILSSIGAMSAQGFGMFGKVPVVPISVTNIGTHAVSNSATSVSVTVGAGGVPSGSLILVAVYENTGPSVGGSVADTAGNTYNKIIMPNSGYGMGEVFYSYNSTALVSTNAITYTQQQGGVDTLVSCCYAVGVLASSNPLDSSVTASTTVQNANPSITSGTPTQAGELFLGVVASYNVTSYTQDTTHNWAAPPTSLLLNGIETISGGTQVNAGTGTITFSPTLGNAANSHNSIIVLGFKHA